MARSLELCLNYCLVFVVPPESLFGYLAYQWACFGKGRITQGEFMPLES